LTLTKRLQTRRFWRIAAGRGGWARW